MAINEETRARMSAAAKARWADPEYRAKVAAGLRRSDEELAEMVRKISIRLQLKDLL